MIPTGPANIDLATLQKAEATIGAAIAARNADTLKVLGFGEISVAVGWPTNEPTMVLKRMAVYANRSDSERDTAAIAEYVERLLAAGADVLPTTTHVVPTTDGRFAGYAVQPFVPKEFLAETTIEQDEPRADHPLLLALRDFAVRHVTPELSADMQLTNFAWDGTRLVLIDITTPIVFTPAGEFAFQISPELLAAIPRFMRGTALKETMSILGKYRSLPDTFQLVLVLLHRIGQGRWVPAAATVFNQAIDTPLDLDAVANEYNRFKKVIPIIKRSAMLQRWWITKVRKRSYDGFITDSFTGAVL